MITRLILKEAKKDHGENCKDCNADKISEDDQKKSNEEKDKIVEDIKAEGEPKEAKETEEFIE